MLIDCPGCAKSYHISRAMLEPNGRSVVCPRCTASWFVTAEVAENAAANAVSVEISAEAVSRRTTDVKTAARTLRRRNLAELPPWPRLRVSRLLLCSVASVGLLMAAIGLRYHVVRHWPEAATAYAAFGLPVNLRDLSLHDVRLTLVGGPALAIEGEITNLKSGKNAVPPLRLSLRDAQAREIYVWTTQVPKSQLATGESMVFSARLAAPPAAAQAVLVSFAPAARESLALQR